MSKEVDAMVKSEFIDSIYVLFLQHYGEEDRHTRSYGLCSLFIEAIRLFYHNSTDKSDFEKKLMDLLGEFVRGVVSQENEGREVL
jgi:hypothetical protein